MRAVVSRPAWGTCSLGVTGWSLLDEGFRFGRVRGWASVAATRSMPIIDRQAEVGLARMGTIGRKQTRKTVSRRKMG